MEGKSEPFSPGCPQKTAPPRDPKNKINQKVPQHLFNYRCVLYRPLHPHQLHLTSPCVGTLVPRLFPVKSMDGQSRCSDNSGLQGIIFLVFLIWRLTPVKFVRSGRPALQTSAASVSPPVCDRGLNGIRRDKVRERASRTRARGGATRCDAVRRWRGAAWVHREEAL